MFSLLKKILGACSILTGILLGLVPLVPGVVLVVIGLELLGISILPWERVRAHLDRFRRRHRDSRRPDERGELNE